ncbi:MAG: hypothetical protein JWQ90_1833 [Hydrocarboniphaga sp.]|uniref:efflux RND transporter periplasmic adaptor subunit n=1 Tax=Hydrocarboniphaga sp. TaxID=2033016 RepID=UPI002610D20E|nr:efflux RND transporter periplasmic adaptor subunit [Hydrocarboniphaga sp.]MDB5969383.1 hypothetical protein [Hydrocarboniphaga sp.]
MNKTIPIAVLVILAAAAGGWWLAKHHSPQAAAPSTAAADRKALYWYDPMKPDQHFDSPGKSPFMDMELVPKYADESASVSSSTIVTIDPRMAQNLGMRTAAVTAGPGSVGIEAVGSVMVDERRIVAIAARAAGWVEHLDVRSVGDVVQRGQVLAGVYSPDLLAAQEELVLAKKLDDPAMIEAARTRLSLLGIGENKNGAQRRVAISAPQSGVVTELLVREGMQVTPGMPLMKLADLSKIWIVVEIPEVQAASVTPGRAAQARLPSLPGRLFSGSVDYVYPLLDAQTRTLRARLAFDNADLALKPGMFAQVSLPGLDGAELTLVPSVAVIRTGTRNVVLVVESAGRYRPVEVTLGPEHDEQIVVISGLRPGQQVVTSGQFLIDSEASLLGAYQRMNAADAAQPRLGAVP